MSLARAVYADLPQGDDGLSQWLFHGGLAQ